MSHDLDERVMQFMMLELPGQPRMMHMGTSHLVHDLHQEVRLLRNTFRHYHVARGDDSDLCKQCGLDLRHEIHTRVDNSN